MKFYSNCTNLNLVNQKGDLILIFIANLKISPEGYAKKLKYLRDKRTHQNSKIHCSQFWVIFSRSLLEQKKNDLNKYDKFLVDLCKLNGTYRSNDVIHY